MSTSATTRKKNNNFVKSVVSGLGCLRHQATLRRSVVSTVQAYVCVCDTIILDLEFLLVKLSTPPFSVFPCTVLTSLTVINDTSFTVLKSRCWLSWRSLLYVLSLLCVCTRASGAVAAHWSVFHAIWPAHTRRPCFTFTSYKFDSCESNSALYRIAECTHTPLCITSNDRTVARTPNSISRLLHNPSIKMK